MFKIYMKALHNTILIFILFILPYTSVSQDVSIEVMPYSVVLWGKASDYSALSLSYERVSIYYFHANNYEPYRLKDINRKADGDRFSDYYISRSSFAMSYEIINIKNGVTIDMIYFKRNFPIIDTSRLQFKISLLIPISNRMSVNYVHISNGFGILNNINIGVDFFSLKYKL